VQPVMVASEPGFVECSTVAVGIMQCTA
jgi:hypothetical protein